MMEGSGVGSGAGSRAGFVLVTNDYGCGSGRLKNIQILRILMRIRIPNTCCKKENYREINLSVVAIVADPDPPDPYVFGPSGSGSISQRYGSGSGSFPFLTKLLSGLK
jgi:hypothetical protein